jgi:hypothetical protein
MFLSVVILTRIFYDINVMFYYVLVLKSNVQTNSNSIVN